jgi:hypothetical protein
MASNNPSAKKSPARPSHEEISRRARQIWESRGQPAGQDDAIWLEAESQLSPPSMSSATMRATGRLERSDDDLRLSDGGAEISARKNTRREANRDEDADI